ncbi:MAG TPA: diguanylate cyclase, partial [Rhodocyclaceae bacterium]|nr:diguanylate cyclase [Rhodocyclaceae bacterium]
MTIATNLAGTLGEVLVVEDTPSSLKLLSDLLAGAGYTVRQAPNGELALWTVETSLPDLILLDINMPGIDGFEVCRRLKANPATAAVPIMFLSAQSDSEDIVSGLGLGAVDYVAKPYVAEEVLARVRTHVALAQMARALEQERESLEVRVDERTAQLQEMMDSLREEIRERKAAEAKLQLAGTVFASSFDAILVMDEVQRILTSNPAFARLTGYEPDEAAGQSLGMLASNKTPAEFFDELWATVFSTGYWTGEIWLRHKDHNVFPALCTLTAARDAAGEITHVVALLLSVAERRDTETLVNFLSHYDALTGLPNRVTAIANFERHLADLTGEEKEVVVLYLGLDRFRQISDLMGHAAGDRVLQVVSGIISDTLFAGDIAYRQGTDEFVILRTDASGLLRTQELVNKLLTELHTEFDVDEGRASVSASVGIASAPLRDAQLIDLVRNAGTALSWVRREGSNGFAYFARDMDNVVRKNYEIEMGLREAMAKNYLQLYYQPQIELNSGEMVGVEALLRWKHPER